LIFDPDERFENYLGIVVSALEVQGYPQRDELIATMHAEAGFQAVWLSLGADVTLCLLSVRYQGAVPTDDRSAQQALLRARLAGKGWEVPLILDLMPLAKTFYLDFGEPDSDAVVDPGARGVGRRCRRVPVVSGRPGVRIGNGGVLHSGRGTSPFQ